MNVTTIDHEALRKVVRRSKTRDWLYKRRWVALFVVLPTLLALVYYGLIASPIYVSQSSFIVKSPGQKAAPTLSLANLVQTTGLSSGQEQTKEVIEYIHSRDALRDLQAQVDVRAKFEHRGADFLSKYPPFLRSPSFENLYRYYQSRISADISPDSGLAVLRVRAFTPEDAYEMNSKLLALSEQLVNKLNERAEGRAIAEAERRVSIAEDRLRNARVALSAYRNQQSLIDPKAQAAGVLDVSNRLITERAALQAQLDLMTRVTPRNPSIPAVRNRIVALGREISAQTGRVVGTPSGIASKLSGFEKLNVEQDFATQMLTAANASLEQARAESQRQQFYVERIVEPNRPDMPTLPGRLKSILIVFAASLCLYFIGWMLVVGILEHAPED